VRGHDSRITAGRVCNVKYLEKVRESIEFRDQEIEEKKSRRRTEGNSEILYNG